METEDQGENRSDWLANRAAVERFASTQWAAVLKAASGDSSEASSALSKLCRTFWYPLYDYLRHRGLDEHKAKDITQGFFELFLSRKALAEADEDRGRFRSFLLKSLQHCLANECRDARRLREGYAANGQASLYEALEGSLTGAGVKTGLEAIRNRLAMSEGAAKVACYRLRKRFGMTRFLASPGNPAEPMG